jgi:hypothetical protein
MKINNKIKQMMIINNLNQSMIKIKNKNKKKKMEYLNFLENKTKWLTTIIYEKYIPKKSSLMIDYLSILI